ncbi:MAG: undecaprenyl diphosphate synthase family protein [Bacteroidales bacterium]|nr:undecaprenyl diphosphate synthase family protein [Bacteroidales bacterium]
MIKPNHILYIPDGDRRFLRKNDLKIGDVYKKSGQKLVTIMEWMHRDFDIPCLTLYAFAKYNLARKKEEVEAIIKGGMEFLKILINNPILDEVDVHFVGEKELIYQILPDTKNYIDKIERKNSDKPKKTIVLSAFDSYKDLEKSIIKCWENGINNPTYSQILENTAIQVPIDIVMRTAATNFARLSGVFIGADQARIYSLPPLAPELEKLHIQEVLNNYSSELQNLKENLE